VTPHSLVKIQQCWGETCCLHLQDTKILTKHVYGMTHAPFYRDDEGGTFLRKMEELYQITRRHKP